MRTIKVIINGTTKCKMKVSAKKAKDVRIQCPEEYVNDTVSLFKNPEQLNLTEHNVDYLSGIIESHKQVLSLKPVFLKRISTLQAEIARILQEEQKEHVTEEKVKESVSVPDKKAKQEDVNANISQSEHPSAQNELNHTAQYSTTNPADAPNLNLDISMTSNTNDGAVSKLDNIMTTFNDTIASIGHDDDTQISLSTLQDDRIISVKVDDDNTTRIKETRQRTIAMTMTKHEKDPDLFLKIVSPKQRIVTKYKAYSPETVTSPVDPFLGKDPFGKVYITS